MITTHQAVLVVGAGGLGCELVKNLWLAGCRHLHVLDCDTVSPTNLNRQLLYRRADVGRAKAAAAADYLRRLAGDGETAEVVAHVCRLEEQPREFFARFAVVVCGLDSLAARRRLCEALVELAAATGRSPPLVDGGSEGLRGHVRVVLPGVTACVDCAVELFPPDGGAYPLCTLAARPRQPEHCVHWAQLVEWPARLPFGADWPAPDPHRDEHVAWLWRAAAARAAEHGIDGVTARLVAGVVRRIVPAVAACNAVVAAACAGEALKLLADAAAAGDNNYAMFNAAAGVYCHALALRRRADCPVCGCRPAPALRLARSATLRQLIAALGAEPLWQLAAPSLRYYYTDADGRQRSVSLYQQAPPMLERATRANLDRSLDQLLFPDAVAPDTPRHTATVYYTDPSRLNAHNALTINFTDPPM